MSMINRYGYALSLQKLINTIKEDKEQENKDRGFTADELIDTINGDNRLICISISHPYKIKETCDKLQIRIFPIYS
jgi:hypothetical protein